MIEPGNDVLDGTCHCGTIQFRVRLKGGLASARRCNCSYCAMRGAVALSASVDDLDVIAGQEQLGTYQFNTGIARHHFCSVCGIYTHHRRRSNPSEYGVNAACLGISPFDFVEVPVEDGVHHPSDTGQSRQIGMLRFIPASEDGKDANPAS